MKGKTKLVLPILVIALLVVSTCECVEQTVKDEKIKEIISYRLTPEQLEKIENYEIKVGYIEASSDYEYGLKLGQRYKEVIESLPNLPGRSILKSMCLNMLSENHCKYLQEYYPARYERLRGIEDGAGINLKKLISEINSTIWSEGEPGCTTSASAPPATVGNEVFLTWNLDHSYDAKKIFTDIISSPEVDAPEVSGLPLFYVRDIEGYNKVFVFSLGTLGITEMPLINDKGLAFVANSCKIKDEGPGLPALELVNKVMDECSTVEEAVKIIENSPRFASSKFGSTNINYLFADAQGKIASIETSHQYFAVKYGRETGGVLAQANHHQWLDYNKTGAYRPSDYVSSWTRAERMWELLRENKGEIDLEKAMSFTADTANGPEPGVGGYASICRYKERVDPKSHFDSSRGGTCFAFVIQPREKIVWWCGAHPDEAPYMKIDAGAVFTQD